MADYSVIIMIVAGCLIVGIAILTYKDMPLFKLFKKWFSKRKHESGENIVSDEETIEIKIDKKDL